MYRELLAFDLSFVPKVGSKMSILRDLPIFKGLSNTEFENLKGLCKEEQFFDGDVLFNEGDSPEAVYIIKRGSVRIIKTEEGRQVELATLFNGEIFGEMGVLNNAPRLASAVVSGEAILLTIDGGEFVRVVAQSPSMSKIVMSTMVGRFKSLQTPSEKVKEDHEAVMIGIFSGTGGVGTSLVTANMAASIKAATGNKVLVFDLDLMFGDQGEILGLKGGTSLSDVVENEVIDIDSLRQCIQSTPAGVDVLRSPAQAEHAEVVMPGFIISCLELLRYEYDYILCDTAHLIHEASLSLLDMVHIPIYLLTAEVLSVKNATRWFSIMDRIHMPIEKIKLLINKYEENVDKETVDFVEEKFGKKTIGRLPMDCRSAKASLNTGKLLVLEDTLCELAQNLKTVSSHIVGLDSEPAKEESFWTRWIRV